MSFSVIKTSNAPAAIGPYSQGCIAGRMLFISGQIPVDPSTGKMITDDIKAATAQCLENIMAILRAADENARLVKVGIFLTDMGDFGKVNEIYATYFGDEPPARACVEVSALPKGAPIEIEAIAILSIG